MSNANVFKDTAYIYHFVGEANYKATYEKYTVSNCSLQHSTGVGRSVINTMPQNTAKLYIFDKSTTVMNSTGDKLLFIEPNKYEALSPEQKVLHWTIGDNEKDYFGETDNNSADPTTGIPNYYKITGYTRHDTGSKRMHHVEVSGK